MAAPATMFINRIDGAESTHGTVREEFIELTFNIIPPQTLPAQYVTGGFLLTPRSVGLLNTLGVDEMSFTLSTGVAQTGTWLVKYDATNQKIQLFTAAAAPGLTTALAEAANTVDITNFVIRVRVIGF